MSGVTKTRMRHRFGTTVRGNSSGSSGSLHQARDPLFNESVQKAIAVLEAFGRRRVLQLGEAAEAVGITRASAQRYIWTLETLGYLQRESQGSGWFLTPRVLQIPHAYLSGHRLIEQSTRHLADLNRVSGEFVSLSEPYGTDMVYVTGFATYKRTLMHAPVGTRLPMHCTGSGRAYLSALPVGEARSLLCSSCCRALTSLTITDRERILALVAEAHIHGYAYSDEECYHGYRAVAAPVIGEGHRPIGAVNVAAPSSRWSIGAMRTKLAPLVIEAARAISSGSLSQAHG